MWKPYLKVIAAEAGQALARAGSFPYHQAFESGGGSSASRREHAVAGKSQQQAQRLKHMRWSLLRRGSRVRGRARQKLDALLASKLATARAWELKEIFAPLLELQIRDSGPETFLIAGAPAPCAADWNR